MDATRRDFLGKVTASAAAFGAMPFALALPACTAEGSNQAAGDFDLTWPSKLTGKHKAVFDMAEIESGYGLWRGNAWVGQVQQFMGATPTDVSLGNHPASQRDLAGDGPGVLGQVQDRQSEVGYAPDDAAGDGQEPSAPRCRTGACPRRSTRRPCRISRRAA